MSKRESLLQDCMIEVSIKQIVSCFIKVKGFVFKYCSLLEFIFIHYIKDFKNFFLEFCFFTTKFSLLCFSFLAPFEEPLIKRKNRYRPLYSPVIAIGPILYKISVKVMFIKLILLLYFSF